MTQNYAELERRIFNGELTLEECRRIGATHKAYGWSCTPQGAWNAEQCKAYRQGYMGAA